jgi:hypothetical protein
MRVVYDYFDFFLNHRRAAEVLKSYPHDFVLITTRAPARTLMERSGDWKLIYSDLDAILFARADSRAARIEGVPVRGRPQRELFP